ncbi:glycerate kinase [Acetobacter sp. AN02]|uniref:glycerate kinase n=1 Tax=Acetobacter sp. AN02 TaxID=2894186 RepID=UPI0024343449|nr:glycerate kinase [Acetobacter sp. AN02]MDG6095100.1 glycerate kinase [Acetobacter sp. AN02]
MKIVIACDSFKESLSAPDVALAIEQGFRTIFPDAEYVRLPAADGGEGTTDAIISATGGRILTRQVTGPAGQPVTARFGITPDNQAIIEVAEAAGLTHVPRTERNPLTATTRGVGELILAALDEGCTGILLGLGGSATNDGGAGMMQALGLTLHDAAGQNLPPGGAALASLAAISTAGLDPRLRTCRFSVASDVTSPLTGPEGASAIFGPQKGATPEMVTTLDHALSHYAALIRQTTGQDIAHHPGAGAAGGTGAALLAFLNATLRPGIDIVLEALGLEEATRNADLVITGEGRLDGQSAKGKTPVGVARIAKRNGCPVIAIAGSLGPGMELVYAEGIDAAFSAVNYVCTIEEALRDAAANLRTTARNIAATLSLTGSRHPLKA